jgi:chemotaxis signal transduction protein
MASQVQLMTPVEALSRGLQRTLVQDNRIVTSGTEEVALRRGVVIGGKGVIMQGARLIMEVLELPQIYPLPNAPRACRGLINLRGGLVPVFDIRRMLGGDASLVRWVLVVDRGEQAAALVVDELPRQVSLHGSNRLTNPGSVEETFDRAVIDAHQVGEDVFFTIDHRQLLSALTGQTLE